MAISETDIHHWNLLDNAFALSGIHAVCDLGQQELQLVDPPSALKICSAFADRLGRAGTDITLCRTSAEMWRKLDRRIVSLDLVGSGEDFLRFDLNFDEVPGQLDRQFDLVTNFGTSEHIMNQYNVFKVMHDLARPGRLMYHSVPIGGYTNHGLISYNLKMFTAVAKVNNYMPLDFLVSVEPSRRHLDPELRELVRDFPGFRTVRHQTDYAWSAESSIWEFISTDANARIIFLKVDDAPFKLPLDLRLEVRTASVP